MRRVQIQLPDDQFARLAIRAREAGESIAATVRRALDVQDAAEDRRARIDAALEVIRTAQYRSGRSDVSRNHDEYFVEAIEHHLGRK